MDGLVRLWMVFPQVIHFKAKSFVSQDMQKRLQDIMSPLL
jgi:hypothetical protein